MKDLFNVKTKKDGSMDMRYSDNKQRMKNRENAKEYFNDSVEYMGNNGETIGLLVKATVLPIAEKTNENLKTKNGKIGAVVTSSISTPTGSVSGAIIGGIVGACVGVWFFGFGLLPGAIIGAMVGFGTCSIGCCCFGTVVGSEIGNIYN